MNPLEEKYKNKGIIQPGNWIVFPKKIAIEFVKECEKEAYEILGIDAFWIGKDFIQPSLMKSIDFCNTDYPEYHAENRYQYSIDFLNKSDDDMFFEVVTKTEPPPIVNKP